MMDANGDLLARLSPAEKRAMLAELLQKRAKLARAPYPMSIGQQAIWFQQQLAPTSPAFNMVGALRIGSRPDVGAIRWAFQAVLDRHAVLRCTFRMQDGAPVAEIQSRQELDFEQVDLDGASPEEVERRAYEDSLGPFDLESGPLFRVRLYSRAPEAHVLSLHVHHTVFDTRSLEIVLEEFFGFYAAHTQGGAFRPASSGAEYADFVRWQNELLAGPQGARLAGFWAKEIEGDLPVLDLLFDHPAPAVPAMRGATHWVDLGSELPDRLQALARSARVTLYTLLLSAFQVLLHRYTGQHDILVGSPAWGRNRTDFEHIVGYCVNPIALRADLSGDPTFLDLLERNRDRVREALANQDYPFPLVVERLGAARHLGRHHVFDVLFNFMRLPPLLAGRVAEVAGLRVELAPALQQEGQFGLLLDVTQGGSWMAVTLRYSSDRLDAATVERIGQHYRVLLERLVAAPETPLSRLQLLTPAERQRELNEWNATSRDVEDVCVHQLFEAQADRAPGRVAVEAAGVTMTYGELEQRANALAHRLRAMSVGRGSLVGLCTDRSTDLVVGLLGILKAGGACLPLEPALPAARTATLLQDAGASVVVTQRRLREHLPRADSPPVCLDTDLAQERTDRPGLDVRPDDLACTIYDVASAGAPTGVEIAHRAIVCTARGVQRRLGFGEDVVLFVPEGIDAALLDFFLPLIGGGRISLASQEIVADARQLAEALERSGATLMRATPSRWRLLVDAGWRGRRVLRALSDAEPLEAGLAQALLDRCAELWTCYGSAETTACSALHHVLSADAPHPIGQPLDNTQIYVLDLSGEPVPPGVVGQIYVGGSGLARGYQNRPDLTAERFVEIGLDDGPVRRLYRTGELGRRRTDGTIERLNQPSPRASLRAHRIEPGANEAALPVTVTERCIAEIWQELLGIPRVDVHDNFYDLGGHSLLSLQAIARIERATGVQLHPQEVALQSLGQLAAHCDRVAGGRALHRIGETNGAADARDGAVAGKEDQSGLRAQTVSPVPTAGPALARGESRQPFFFGPPGEQLFGLLHLPEAGVARDAGIVVCQPFGQEYIRAHRSLMLLGNRLARAGFPVLRFDYFGCGDSAGASDDGSIERWIADIGTAMDEVRKRCGITRLSLVGLRLGGALAARAAAARGGVDRLVLWDPVVRGDAHLDELRTLHRLMLASAYVTPSRTASVEEILGFPLHERLRAGLVDIDLAPDVVKAAHRVLLLESGRERRLAALAADLAQARAGLEHCHVADQQVWLEEPFRGLVASRVIESVAAWLAATQP